MNKLTLLLLSAAVVLTGCASIGAKPQPKVDSRGNYVLEQEAYLCYGVFQAPGCMQRAALERVRGKAKDYCSTQQKSVQEVNFGTSQQTRYSNPTSLKDSGALYMQVTYYFRCT